MCIGLRLTDAPLTGPDPYDGDTSAAATREALRALRLVAAHSRKGLTG